MDNRRKRILLLSLSSFDISHVTNMNSLLYGMGPRNVLLNKTSFHPNVDLTQIVQGNINMSIVVKSAADKEKLDALGFSLLTVTVG